MTHETLRKALMDGAQLVFAKRLNANREVRACYAVVFDRRKGFHIVEQKKRQVRLAMENGGGIYLLELKNDKLMPVTKFGFEPITELDVELEEETYQKLPRYDLTERVQSQRILKKIGFF